MDNSNEKRMVDEAVSRNVLIRDTQDTFNKCLATMIRKNADYSGEKEMGSDPFRNFMNAKMAGVSIQQGILVRMVDKFSRASGLLANGNDPKVQDESLIDTLDDLINYTAILKSTIINNIK